MANPAVQIHNNNVNIVSERKYLANKYITPP